MDKDKLHINLNFISYSHEDKNLVEVRPEDSFLDICINTPVIRNRIIGILLIIFIVSML